MVRIALPALVALTLLAGCRRHDDGGPIEVSVIGSATAASRAGADRAPLDAPSAALIGATRQGLVRFDAGGQIVPGIAARWIVSDGGRSLIFRLPDLPDPGARPIDAEAVARRIHAAIAANSSNPLKPLLGAIEEVDAVTPQVIDVELKAPRPNLLELFAQPDLTMGAASHGPFAIVASGEGAALLRPLPDRDADPDDPSRPPPMVRLRGQAAGRAIARFVAGRSDLVLGGRFTDLPVAHLAGLPRGALRFDPVEGLFGLAFVQADAGFTADAGNRRALAMAVDRDRIGPLLGVPGWSPITTIVAPGTPEIEQPATPSWSALPLADRQAQAQGLIGKWRAAHGSVPVLRVAMPPGPGATLLFASIARDWRAVGVQAVAVGPNDMAELRLIDAVAPADIASFYLRSFACDRRVICTDVTDRLLVEARDADSLAERGVLLMQADALMADDTPFIALGQPVRWSLVAPGLDLYRDSPRAIHPLNELRTPLKR
ncbi:ABC transporter substrate-binding protein [Sphingomonas sp. CGMCC 1.13654]|uniref:ABC transporter substrate-binding protein n=1 Tax=Sphingomonas chungangi TaxID=2683589 RepID=A0A838L542_9SPHN|nr:ABC transporter substrate-binding protein [Sphingomonas chungangi]MBA2934284.1 ABC transporter substrate-binding protein [Sphingomonas chungangi]MVW57325.1 ABC transporter substrate-binding protein [Sphingomonas chungangi]